MSSSESSDGLPLERVVLFSDAVFAIAITLLVLEIKVPHLEVANEAAIRASLHELLPKFFGYLMSFLIVGKMWTEHHKIFHFIGRCDEGLLWRNLLLLLAVGFVPFPTALISEYTSSRTAFVLYVATFEAVGLAQLWIWLYATRAGLLKPDTAPDLVRKIRRHSLAIPLGAALAIVCVLLTSSLFLASIACAAIPVLRRLLDRPQRAAKPAPAAESAPVDPESTAPSAS